MAKVENVLDIYWAVGTSNSQRQENLLEAIMKNVILHDRSWSQKVLQ